jgi:hypothetical protein
MLLRGRREDHSLPVLVEVYYRSYDRVSSMRSGRAPRETSFMYVYVRTS